MAGVAQIGEERTGGVVEDIQTGLPRDVVQVAVSIVLIQPVGQSARLQEIDFIPAVAVDVRHRDAKFAVKIDAAGRIETRPPIGNAARELLHKGRFAGED